MASFKFSGLKQYELQLAKLADSEEIIIEAIKGGAGVLADEIRKNIENLPVRTAEDGYGRTDKKVRGVTQKGKEGLLDGFGITPVQLNNGKYNAKIGFDGYNKQKTKKYKNGQPNQLVARGVEFGASWLEKTPFISPAVKSKRKEAEKKMQEVIEAGINKIIK